MFASQAEPKRRAHFDVSRLAYKVSSKQELTKTVRPNCEQSQALSPCLSHNSYKLVKLYLYLEVVSLSAIHIDILLMYQYLCWISVCVFPDSLLSHQLFAQRKVKALELD